MSEYSSWLAAEAAGIAHARVGIGLTWMEGVAPSAVARAVIAGAGRSGSSRDAGVNV